MERLYPFYIAVKALVDTKRYKEKHGKTDAYETMRKDAWMLAEQALKPYETSKEGQSSCLTSNHDE